MSIEKRDIGFTGDIKIPREISDIKADIVAGLDLREIKWISVGIVLAIIDAVIVFGVLKQFGTLAILSPAFFLAPFVTVAKVKVNGINLENWLMILYDNNIKGSPVRTNETVNEYERLEQLYEKNHKTKINKRERNKEIKQKIKNSQYKGVV